VSVASGPYIGSERRNVAECQNANWVIAGSTNQQEQRTSGAVKMHAVTANIMMAARFRFIAGHTSTAQVN
jgi:hypothetical protein